MDVGLSGGGMIADGIHLPPPGLADCLSSALVTSLPGGPYILPAALHPVLLVILQGGIVVRRGAGERPLPGLVLCGGTRGVREARAEPGTRIITVPLQPVAVRGLFGLPGGALMEEAVDPAELLDAAGRGALARFVEALPSVAAVRDEVRRLWDLLAALRRGGGRSSDLWVPLPLLAFPADLLAERFGLGPRQFERRFRESYGQPLRGYRQQLRCSRMLASLRVTVDPAEGWAAIAAAAGYVDQAHLCRDVRRFTGHTPTGLQAGVAGDDPAFWPYRVDPVTLARHFGPTGF